MNDARLIHDFQEIQHEALEQQLEIKIDRQTGNFELRDKNRGCTIVVATPQLAVVCHYLTGIIYGRKNPLP